MAATNTKYSEGDKVLISAKVDSISIDDGEIIYRVKIKNTSDTVTLSIEEDDIVGEDTGNSSTSTGGV